MCKATMTRLLMCRPDYYGIEYEINPWMDRRKNADRALAMRQWQELYTTLTQDIGVQVELVEQVKGLPDMVFTANAGYVQGNLFVSSRFRHKERAGEEPHFREWFAKKGFQVMSLPGGYFFEGEGDALPCRDNLFAGYITRSDIRSHKALGELLGKRVLSLELVDQRFYHLDTCFCPIGDNAALYYPGAFDGYGLKVIREFTSRAIPVPEADALKFGCNTIILGKQAVINKGCQNIKGVLEENGYTVHEVDLSEFLKAGGSAKCLVLFLDPR